MANYWQKFGLTSDPFVEEGMDCDPYFPARWQQQLDLLRHFARSSAMALLITGVSGSGKSVFMDLLFEQIEAAAGVCKVHGSAGVTADVLQELVVRHLGMPVVSLHEVNFQQRFMQQIDKMAQAGEEFYLVIDNAQKLPKSSLALLIDMAEWQSNDSHPLHLILFGGPQLDAMMAELTAQHLGEAMTHTIRLDPFSANMTKEYIEHRMREAGYEGELPLTEAQLAHIQQASNGIPAKINVIARQTLLESEPPRQRKAFTKKESKPRQASPWTLPLWGATGAGFVVLLILFMVFYFRAPEEVVVKQVALRDEATAAVTQDTPEAPTLAATTSLPAQTDNAEMAASASVPIAVTEATASPTPVTETENIPDSSQYISDQFEEDDVLPTKEAKDSNVENTLATESIQPAAVTDVAETKPVAETETKPVVVVRTASKTEVPAKKATNAGEGVWIPLTNERTSDAKEIYIAPPKAATVPKTTKKKPVTAKAPSSKAKPTLASTSRLTQDERYLMQVTPSVYTIQIAAAVNGAKLKQFIKEVGIDGQVYYFQTVKAGQPWHVAVYGRYASQAEAQQAAGNLPTRLLVKQKPWIRSFGSIQSAIKTRI